MPLFDIPSDGDLLLEINGLSKHFNTDEKFNENNKGLGLQYQWTDEDLIKMIKLGQYLNSLGRNSNYAALGAKKRLYNGDNWHIDAGGLFGGITGYGNGITPAALPLLSIGNGAFGVNIMASPAIKGYTPATVMFNTEIPLK